MHRNALTYSSVIKKLEIVSWLIILLINFSHGKSSRAHCCFGDRILQNSDFYILPFLPNVWSHHELSILWTVYILYTDYILLKLQYVLNILLVIVIDHLIGVRFKKLARLDKDDTKERDDVELKRCSVFCSGAVQREEKLVKILIVAIKGYWLSFPTCLGDKVSINTGPCERSVLPHGPADFGVKPASSG